MAKKSLDRKSLLSKQQYLMQDISQDELLMQHINDSIQQRAASSAIDNKHKFRSMAPHGSLAGAAANMMEETASFEQKLQGINGQQFMINESTRNA